MADNKDSTALAVQDEPAGLERPQHALLRPVVSPVELIRYQKEVHELIASALEKDRDYGVIPGTKKPTLLKPGAERVGLAFGTFPRYVVVGEEIDHNVEISWLKRRWTWGKAKGEKVWTEERGTSLGLYRYVIGCELVQRSTGDVVGYGIGSCSTLESKYLDRPRDLENTVLKMAQKRAFVAATLNAYALSDRFTQDMEDQAQAEVTGKRQAQTNGGSKGKPRSSSGGGGKASGKQRNFMATLAQNPELPDSWAERLLKMLEDDGLSTGDASTAIGLAKEKIEKSDPDKEPDPGPPPGEVSTFGDAEPEDDAPPPVGDDDIPY